MLVHTYIDPFAVDPHDAHRLERARLSTLIHVLNAEIERLELRIDALYREQMRVPEPDWTELEDWEINAAEAQWDDVWNTYEFKIERLISRVKHMYDVVFEAEFEIWWKYTAW